MKLTEDLKKNYLALWDGCVVLDDWLFRAKSSGKKIILNKPDYSLVSKITNVPWFIVGLIHKMEANFNFKTHLHNGDSLNNRTVQVPRGRPIEGKPPFTWLDSAIDAIRYDGLDKVECWDIATTLYQLEKYNGFGYRKNHPHVNTPYLWSGTNQYTCGKYIADGLWSSAAVSGQVGCVPILFYLKEVHEVSFDEIS